MIYKPYATIPKIIILGIVNNFLDCMFVHLNFSNISLVDGILRSMLTCATEISVLSDFIY